MRYLNKIIFINSAAVKYAEIDLNGNTHFIGNQGAGKTALLRAVLFFYNAGKTRLGIGPEKRRFDDYYFEYLNSYIIYEVNKEHYQYCVLAYKVNGKTAFRFIDAAYNRDFFIDKDGRAYGSWEKIRTALGTEVHYTRLITNYEEYRKIIYGDNKDLKTEFRKYAIIESKQYQNIPRTIQNVFLNAKLEADFIKETIIKSISDEIYEIDLENYSKSHLRDFESQINAIRLWTRKNRAGQIIIRQQADKIIAEYRIINYINQEQKEAAARLAYRMEYISREKINVQIRKNDESKKLADTRNAIARISELHKNQEINLNSEIRFYKDKLKKATVRQQEYEHRNIYNILEKSAQKESLTREKYELEKEKNLLESQFAEINHKYQALITQIENQQTAFENNKISELNRLQAVFMDRKIEIVDKYSKLTDREKEQAGEKITTQQQTLQALKDDENRLKRESIENRHKLYFQEEITRIKQQTAELSAETVRLQQTVSNDKNQLKNSRKEWEFEKRHIQQKYQQNIDIQLHEIKILQHEIDRLTQKIEQSKDSFYAWLNNNYEQWQQTIGKVIDEEVLYQHGLNPDLTDPESRSFFGVEIDLRQLQRKVKSVAELKEKIKEINNSVLQRQTTIRNINAAEETELEKLNHRFRKLTTKLNDRINFNEYKISSNEKKIKKLQFELDEWHKKADTEKANILQQLETHLARTANEIEQLQKAIDREREIEKRKLNRLNREKEKELTLAAEELQRHADKLKNEIHDKLSHLDERIRELQQQKNSELGVKGADTGRLNKIAGQLHEIEAQLDFIEKNNTLVIEYRKDKRELFDNVDDFKNNLKVLENKLSDLRRQYDERKAKLEAKATAQEKTVNAVEKVLAEFHNDLECFEKFKKSDIFRQLESISIPAEKTESGQTAADIIENIKNKYFQRIEQFNNLKSSINNFTGNFTENNIFKFKVKFNDDAEYLNFAVELKEFIEENKIVEYEKRINERFAHIVQLIGRETAELVSKEAEIEKIIKKINADFISKNFVKAIKEMEMRIRKSTNPVVNLLLQIKDFNDENGFLLGESNLFTTNESGRKNQQAVSLLKQLVKELEKYKHPTLSLSESFDLEFRIVENDNDSGWVEKLSNVGSEGTDVLIKAIVNILLLNVFKEHVSKRFRDFKLHCMMDEIGKLHPVNVKGILRFANERNILLINSSPTSQNAMDYKYTYKLSKEPSKTDNKKYFTRVTRLIKVN